MSRPYLYHYAASFLRSIELSLTISRKELEDAGFEVSSSPSAWEHFAANNDTLVVVTSVPLSSSKCYVHVLATSNAEASAKKWASEIMQAIKESKMVMID